MQLREKLSKDDKLQRDQIMLDLEAVLRLPQGRRVLLRILERTGVYRNAFTGEQATTDLRLGEQNIGLWLIAQMEAVGPTEYPELLLEAARNKDKERPRVLDPEE